MEDVRDFADGILIAIGEPALTDVEAESLPATMDEIKIYQAVADVINARGYPDNAIEKLNAYAVLNNVDFSAKKTVHNNIFLGASLET